MFGLMEIQELLSSYNNLYPGFESGIVPTVLLPLAFLSTGISVVATFVAGLFGVKLKAEGPRKLLELLLRPRILISAMVLNAAIYGGMQLYTYTKNGPVPLMIQSYLNKNIDYIIEPQVLSDQKSDLFWQQSISEGIFASGVIYRDELFVGSQEGNLFVLNKDTGKVTHKIWLGKFLSPTPVLYKGHLYFGEGLHASHHMRVYKFDPQAKKVVASFKTKGHTEILPVIREIEGKEYLYQAAGGDGLYALDPHSMKKIWHYKDGHMDGFILFDDNAVYIGSGVPKEEIGIKRPYAYKIDAKSGKLIWKKELPLSSWYGPVKSGDRICFIQGELHFKSHVGGINCFSKAGKRESSVLVDSPVIGKPLVVGENLIFNDFNGGVHSWNSLHSKLNWSLKDEKANLKYSYSSLQMGKDGHVIFVNPKGHISHIDIQNGEVHRSYQFAEKENVFADPLMLEEGHIIFGMKGSIKYYRQ
ncbi:PQQ-binding-like beta-propeller repeat protein [Bacteriovorax sp. DB6_IX]|uniref:PQQ-binding-like beta-propeller repeat protein n=1 Tax=Bacteriovorax sp. DB6_IX TaxID=1353530 RepID=UPI0005593836|nr:PQQ-binding-like beta-propeller repeat protein [Bacteriovorax sp. DB6_IX]